MDKRGFDNLANNEQGKEEAKQNQKENEEKPKTLEEPASCEHLDQRERLQKDKGPEGEENQDADGRESFNFPRANESNKKRAIHRSLLLDV